MATQNATFGQAASRERMSHLSISAALSNLHAGGLEHFRQQRDEPALELYRAFPTGSCGDPAGAHVLHSDKVQTRGKDSISLGSRNLQGSSQSHKGMQNEDTQVHFKKKCKTGAREWGLQNILLDMEPSQGSIISRSATDLSSLRDSPSSMDVTGRTTSMSSLQPQRYMLSIIRVQSSTRDK